MEGNGNGSVNLKPMSLEKHNKPVSIEPEAATPLWKIVIVAAIAAGVQFGWALQLSLLTPYVQLLGIPHQWSAYIWLCGPISGMLVQPLVGYYSDRSTSRFGRRRPFIVAGAALVAIAVFLIGYAADIGHGSGDQLGNVFKPRAITVFIVGFWILDVANNMLQGPCRALLADLSGGNHQKMRMANGMFSFFMAMGNILGYAAGAYPKIHKMFPFATTTACDLYCANLKSCFFLSITLLVTITVAASVSVKEKVFVPEPGTEDDDVSTSGCKMPFFGEIFGALKDLPRPMWILLLVTCLNWIAWFPFLLFDTDWMGKEVYGGEVGKGRMYDLGIHAGALGLMINSIVLAFQSLANEPIAKKIGGVKRLWGGVNFLLAICLALTVPVTKLAQSSRRFGADGLPLKPDAAVKGGALALFALLGIPLSVTYSIPFALASIFSSNAGAGQGLSLGVLNLAIVIPQMFVSITSGPFDNLFGGGNLPAFVVGAVAAAASGIIAFTMLPTPTPEAEAKMSLGAGGFH